MASIKEKLLESLRNEDISYGTLKALVVNYDNIKNRANIEFEDPNQGGRMSLENVPVQIGTVGVSSTALNNGDYVWVSFINGSPLMPKIIGVADEEYEVNTREKQRHINNGALLTCINEDVEELDSILSNSWIDEENNDISKYYEYISFDVEAYINKFKSTLGYYNNDEVGLTLNGATLKINKDGVIDIFTGVNQGIRINPNDSTIFINSDNKLIINSNNIKIKANNDIDIEANSIKIKGEIINNEV